jgi:hypothetical protein
MAHATSDTSTMRRGLLAVALLGVAAVPARADSMDPEVEPPPEPPATPLDRGKFSLGVSGGWQNQLGHRYFAIGGALGYFVLDGFEVGLGAVQSLGDGPWISKLTPSLRYIAQPLLRHSPIVPYVGVFYNHWFIGSGLADVDTLGTRGGFVYVSGRAILGLGVVYEREVSKCVMDCSSVYPDVTISVSL